MCSQLYGERLTQESFQNAVVNRKSFDVARVINEKILDACGTEKVARVLVGNKSDMPGVKREVPAEEGAQAAQQMGNVPFLGEGRMSLTAASG